MLTPDRKFSAGSGYRCGFNGQEKSIEINGTDNLTTAEFWEYHSRVGRRWNIDPVPNESESPYSTFLNNPIIFEDIHGDAPPNIDRIANPSNYVENWGKLSKKEQDFMIQGWKIDIKKNSIKKNVATEVLQTIKELKHN
jgi:hypothetical protein